MIKDKFQLESAIRKVLGIEMLEYEDKNLLNYDNKQNAEMKMMLLEDALDYVSQTL